VGHGKYTIGQLVSAVYDFEYYSYYVTGPMEREPVVYYGIITAIRAPFGFYEFGEMYEVLCIDGHARSFCEWEIQILYPHP
jgi:hypothetical protein